MGRPGIAQGLEREDHVIGGDRAAVVEPRFGAQVEGDPGTVLGHLKAFGDQTIEREGLVPSPLQQTLEDVVPSRRGRALDEEGIEAVEGAAEREPKRPPFGRLRIDVLEVGKAGVVLGRAMHGDAMHAFFGGGGRGEDEPNRKYQARDGGNVHVAQTS